MQHLLIACLVLLALMPLAPVRAEDAEGDDPPPRPDPALTSTQVVTLQLDALVAAADPRDEQGMLTVWRFASPSNQAATGPYENFDRMVRTGYASLVGHARHEVVDQRPVEEADVPTEQFLVKVVDGDGAEHLFVWVVSRQAEGELEGCWMTDGVAPVEPPPVDPGRERVV